MGKGGKEMKERERWGRKEEVAKGRKELGARWVTGMQGSEEGSYLWSCKRHEKARGKGFRRWEGMRVRCWARHL